MRILPVSKPLSLRNEGFLELVFIGVGSAFTRSLYHTNFLIIKGDDHLLVDFGTTGPMALQDSTGVDLSDIVNLLPTHSHCDHIGGIEQLALWNRYIAVPAMKKPKLNIIINEEYEKILWNMSLRGGMEWNEVNDDGQTLTFDDYFNIIRPQLIAAMPRPLYDVKIGGLNIRLFGTNHIPEQAPNAGSAFPTFGVMIDDRIFYSGDTKFDPDLINLFAPKAEWMFHDTSFAPNPVHSSLPELRTLDESIRKKMFLVHYGDAFQNQDVSGFAGLTQKGVRYIFD